MKRIRIHIYEMYRLILVRKDALKIYEFFYEIPKAATLVTSLPLKRDDLSS